MAKRQFKSESKRVLDMMINSIYTHKEVFLREIISNASDALDKLYFKSLTDDSVGMDRGDFKIEIKADRDARTLTVSDNGIGMTEKELDENLGKIAKSGSADFTDQNELSDDVDIIGRFGVGFYSAFIVADKITVISKAFGEDEAHKWESSGVDGYTVSKAERDGHGTDVILHLKADTADDNYSEFLDSYRIKDLVKQYSDYIRYPILMDMPKSRKKEGSDEYEDYTETETLNSMTPLWRKNKKDVTEEEYKKFYQSKFHSYDDPLAVIHQHVEGTSNYTALLYIPSKADYNYYSKDFEKGPQLYSKGVLIMEHCPDLIPDCFSFIKGLVDTEDLSLNVSRETLQHDRQVAIIRNALEKRIKKELSEMLRERRDDYEKFFKAFGLQIKYSLYESFGQQRDLLEDLLIFNHSGGDKPVTLEEYSKAMPEDQKYIYYASGRDMSRLSSMPQADAVKEKGYDIIYLTDDVDEFMLSILGKYGEKEYRSITSGDLGLEDAADKKIVKDEETARKDMLDYMKNVLGDEVKEVHLSSTLSTHPVGLSAKGALSIGMEKILNSMPNGQQAKAERVLEINSTHPVYKAICAAWDLGDRDKVSDYTRILLDEAKLIEGLPLQDPSAFVDRISSFMN
ncbi:MAG: molecular chaperone HtpG [Oscillospiraceae bacterium]|jgi:molecular chaperone HtpG